MLIIKSGLVFGDSKLVVEPFLQDCYIKNLFDKIHLKMFFYFKVNNEPKCNLSYCILTCIEFVRAY